MSKVVNSFCRICLNHCAVQVQVTDGRVTGVRGDPANPLFKGYTCIKGRSQADFLYHPKRLLHSQKRMPDGRFEPISLAQAMDEIAERLSAIHGQYGADAIASYAGTMLFTSYTTSMPMLTRLMDTLGSQMRFNTDTIDKGGKLVAESFHGRWMAPASGFDQPDVMLLIGIDPMVTFTGLPAGNPGSWLKAQVERGMRLIVIDPRRSYVAKRAHLHLRPKPGTDVYTLACFLRVILAERLYDEAFVADNVTGLEALRRNVDPFDPESVAERTGLTAQDLVKAARMLAGRKRGFIMAGTGPHMAATGTLTEYLVLAIQSLCGYWLREGDTVTAPPTLLPTPKYIAQAKSPDAHWADGEAMGELGLRRTKAGLPVTTLPEQILANKIRALITVGGNPAVALPDHHKAIAGLKALDLHVQVDPWMSRTAELADYVIAPTMPLEVAATTQVLDFLTGWTGYGLGASYAHYTPAVVAPPNGAEVIDDWKFLHGLDMRLQTALGSRVTDNGVSDLADDCSTDEFIANVTANSRVPLAQVMQKPCGSFYPDDEIVVSAKEPGWIRRLDVGNDEMMSQLRRYAESAANVLCSDEQFALRLICRRHLHVYNSSCNFPATHRGKPYNPAFLNPADMQRLSLSDGEEVRIRSAHGEVRAIVEADGDLLPGLVSMMFAFGPTSESDIGAPTHLVGTNPNELTNCTAVYDPYTGQPRMSNLPVDVVPVATGRAGGLNE